MKRLNTISWIAIIVIIAAGIIYYYETTKKNVDIPKIDIVVVNQDVSENTIISEDMVSLRQVYESDILNRENIYLKSEDVIGKRAMVPLYKDEFVNKSRVLENQPYMNNLDDKKIISFNLIQNDRAISIKNGDYIDIWAEPNKEGVKVGLLPEKIFEKIKVIQLKNEYFVSIESLQKEQIDILTQKSIDEKELVPLYISINLNDEDITKLFSIDTNYFNVRIAKYGENHFMDIINDVLDEEEMKYEESIDENSDESEVNSETDSVEEVE